MSGTDPKEVGLPPLPTGEGWGEGSGQARLERTAFARSLRQNATPAEKALWRALRSRSLAGAKFRRQQPCGPYVLDFSEWSSRLIIEVDGDTHATGDGPARDARRDAYLTKQGWRVLRFTNRDILSNLDGVLHVVAAALAIPHPDPLPQGEGAEVLLGAP